MIVGMLGFASSGKNTAGKILADQYGFIPLSFASILKDTVSVMFQWDRKLLEGDTDESRQFRDTPDLFWTEKLGYEITPRKILQTMGTDVVRNIFHTNFWVLSLEKSLNKNKSYVITDVRFPNEIDWINNQKGFVVRVSRGPEPEWFETARLLNHTDPGNQVMEQYPTVHYSEWAWIGHSPLNYQLDNSGSVDMLARNIDHMMAVFRGPSEINPNYVIDKE